MNTLKKYFLLGCIFLLPVNLVRSQQTETVYLSGTGYDNTVDWQFYCTDGRKAGEWTTIPVPSNWEMFGFGTYNYGHAKDSLRAKESGLYKHTFQVPDDWKDKTVYIVFEGAMTDTKVTINGESAGPKHQGAFYQFRHEISKLLDYGQENLLEVRVDKHSSNASVNDAEREGDFWIFGGIFRPVYLEVKPKPHIKRVALNALADGTFEARLYLDNILENYAVSTRIVTSEGEVVHQPDDLSIQKGDSLVHLKSKVEDPALWSPEFPNLYFVEFILSQKDNPVHRVRERFGFRTVELRQRDGVYLNGKKIKFKGINRHCFWPESGRTTSKSLSIEDALLIKDMNMNAVRNAHYPADKHFLDVCDSLGIMVMDELAGWHGAYDTKAGTKLVREMLQSNMNHPSIVIWANGNEGGHNDDLDPLFDSLDVQNRPVCHPWEVFRGMDTQHYINYDYGNGTHFHGHEVVFATEFLHGLYDGGHGAGLYDYWEYMWKHPLSAGGFLWDFSDNAIVRTDRDGELDTDGDHAADGVMGPYREKEGSYYTIQEVWSPVFFEQREITSAFDGTFVLENRFHFTNIDQCSFEAELVQMPKPGDDERRAIRIGDIHVPDIDPGHKGVLQVGLPDKWSEYDVLYITVFDPHGKEIYTWSWPITLPGKMAAEVVRKKGDKPQILSDTEDLLKIRAAGITYTFDQRTGLLAKVENTSGEIPFHDGPVLCDGIFDFEGIETYYREDTLILEYALGEESHYKTLQWLVYPSGWIALDLSYRPTDYEFDHLGVSFSFPEEQVTSVRWMGNGPYRVWKNRVRGTTLDVWEKDHNNTITGHSEYIYPEFKGYHANVYWVKFITEEQPFTVVVDTEDIYLRLFTPEFPEESYNTAPAFPAGDISFMHGIPPIGTKSQVPEDMGPSGKKNMYFDYWKARAKEMTLYFDFSDR